MYYATLVPRFTMISKDVRRPFPFSPANQLDVASQLHSKLCNITLVATKVRMIWSFVGFAWMCDKRRISAARDIMK